MKYVCNTCHAQATWLVGGTRYRCDSCLPKTAGTYEPARLMTEEEKRKWRCEHEARHQQIKRDGHKRRLLGTFEGLNNGLAIGCTVEYRGPSQYHWAYSNGTVVGFNKGKVRVHWAEGNTGYYVQSSLYIVEN